MNNSVTLRDAHGKFHDFLRSNKKASATILAYGKDIDQLIVFLEELKREHVHDVSSSDIQAFLAKLQGTGYTAKSPECWLRNKQCAR